MDPTGQNPKRSSRLNKATAWYIEALEAGNPPTKQEIKRRYPDVFTQLLSFAQNYQQVRDVGGPSTPVDKAEPEIVRRLGDFEVLDRLGIGGMGVVYKARQKSLNRYVALKFIRDRIASQQDVERFRREATATARLEHDNIVSVYDFKESEGQYYLVMEYVHGPTLANLLRSTPFDVTKTAEITKTVAETLHYAHRQGILHRDVKPSNIMLVSDSKPKLTDFGLAKRIAVDQDGSLTPDYGLEPLVSEGLTASGSMVGTFLYMAPEQTQAGTDNIGPTVDVYGLGATLYELLTGRPPFLSNDLVRLLQEIREGDPTAPRRIDANIPIDLERICLKALDKDPSRRYSTAGEFADDLGRFLDGQAVLARSIGPIRRTGKWIKRNPARASVVGLIATALLMITAGGYAFAVQEARYGREASKLAAQEAEARTEAESLLAQSYTDKGLAAIDKGDVFAALPWLVKSLQLDAKKPEAFAVQKRRCSILLQHAPRLTQMWFHEGAISNLEMGPRGKLLAVSSHDRTTTIWNIETGDAVAGPLPHDGIVFHASFDSNARRIVTAAGDAGAYLWDVTATEPRGRQVKHGKPVSIVAFHPDGQSFATGSGQKHLALDNRKIPIVPTMKRIGGVLIPQGRQRTIQLPARGSHKLFSISDIPAPRHEGSLPGWINHVGFSPDGQWLLAAGGAITGRPGAKLIHTQSLEPKEMAWEFSGDVNHFCFNGNQPQVVFSIGSFRRVGYAQVWDIASNRSVGPRLEHSDKVVRAFFFSGGESVVTASWDGSARAWEVSSGTPLGLPMLHDDRINDAALNLTREYFATACRDGTARVWRPDTGQPLTPLLRHGGAVTAVAFTPNGEFLATGDNKGIVRLWRVQHPHGLQIESGQQSVITRIIDTNSNGRLAAVIGKRTRMAYSSTAGLSRVVERIEDSRLAAVTISDGQLDVTTLPIAEKSSLSISGQFGTVVSRNEKENTSEVSVFDLGTGKRFRPALTCPSPITHATCSYDGNLLLTVAGAKVTTWRYDSKWNEINRTEHPGNATLSIISPDTERVASVVADDRIRLWSTHQGDGTELSEMPKGPVGIMAFSPNGGLFAAATGKIPFTDDSVSEVHIWDANGQHRIGPLPHQTTVTDIQFDLRRNRILTASEDGSVYFWDLDSGEPVAAGPLSHQGPIHSMRLSADGNLIATASGDRTARLWDATSGHPISAALQHASAVRSVSFASDDQALVTGCEDGAIWIWPHPASRADTVELNLLSELLSNSRLATSSTHGSMSFVLTQQELKQRWERLKDQHRFNRMAQSTTD